MLGVILFRLSENSFLMDDISEKIFKKELNKLFLVKIRIREDYTWLSTTWRSRIWNEEILNTHDSSHSVSLNLKGDTSWKPTNGQIKLHERAYTCGADWGWRTIFIKSFARSGREIEELKRRCYQEKIQKEQRRLEDFPTQHDQESRTVSLFFNDVGLLSSNDVLSSSSSSYYFELKKALPRCWNAAKYTRGYEDSWKRFRSSACSTKFWWITQWFKKFGDIIGD